MMSNADIYHEMIIDYSRNPLNFGKLENPDVTYHDSNPLCGDSIDIDLKIKEDKISDIKFHGKGCAICMACSSVLTELTKGKGIDDVKKINKNDILSELGLEHLQAVRIKCALLSLKVLKYALYSYLAKHLKVTEDADKLKEEAASLY
ncbi:MAG: iron-sulfur cluster assembly scaffold protein [Nitrosopumilaceae archaeon]